ncbi:hypothetical protein OAA57_00150 [bacterium]|jgi:uncharacterized protein YdgA (DUF945 family)|nr:hypothetical protein [bacterium]MDB4349972.1 hypothetical protein [bacterium]
MSTLHANTVETSSGGPVTLTNQSAAKAFIATEGEATPTIRISLNHSSVTDNSVGEQTMSYTNNFSEIGCLVAGTHHNAVVVMHQILNRSTSTHNVKTHDHAAVSEDDLGKKHAIFGDLA